MGNALTHRSAIPENEVVVTEVHDDAIVSRHQGFRTYQEDDFDTLSFIVGESTAHLYAVFDGHGGSNTVQQCKQYLLKNIAKCIQYDSELPIEQSMIQSFITTEQHIPRTPSSPLSSQGGSPVPSLFTVESPQFESSQTDLPSPSVESTSIPSPTSILSTSIPAKFSEPLEGRPPPLKLTGRLSQPHYWLNDDGSGCCALVCLINDKQVCIASTGDCRALLLYKNGTYLPINTEHKPTVPGEEERIKAAGLYVSQNRVLGELAVTRAFGDFKYKGLSTEASKHAVTCIPSCLQFTLDKTMDKIVLMTDGIYEGISMEILVHYLQFLPIEDQIKRILTHCLQPGKSSDNMTLMVIPL